MGLKSSAPNPKEDNPFPAMNAKSPFDLKQSGNGDLRQKLLITALVKARAELIPDGLALVSDRQTLTYGELEVRANRLAHHLRTLGVGPEVIVGLCLGRSPLMVVAALAILKAGGAYIPLDPDYPAERLRFMLEDAKAAVLIARQEIGERISGGRWKTLDIEKRALQISDYPETAPEVSLNGNNLAYVIYTSGSTGRPKGVQITHQSLLNLVQWHQRAFAISPSDRASQVASIGFDAAVWELWPNLAAGSSVHFPDEAVRVAPEPLRDWLVAERITVSFVPTPLAEALIALEWPEESALRLLLTGGDALHHYPSARLPFQLINNYGPTECTVVATSGLVTAGGHADGVPPIGRPIDDLQVYILDEYLQPVPNGAIGELHIAGRGVGRGYLNRPDLNAQKFIANPFSQTPGDRMYKTGDLARYLPDGQIAFVGRIDEQIKVRGYRIEPEEIATLLDRCYGVEASVVVARGENGDTRLIAYVVPTAGVKLDHDSLQAYLKKYLPDYMIPAAFVRIDHLPIAPNGKIDRAMLPAPTAENTSEDKIRVGPSTPVEARVVAILAQLLGVQKVGVHDNFFFLGGHSLLGTQLIARARDSFGIELPLRTVFDSPTASQLSAEIERMLRQTQTSAAD
jgi:amino acid adenylation domain-containing protein